MSRNDLDRQLARLFADLRSVDDASIPGFRQVLTRARPIRGASWSARIALLAVCAVVLAVALLVLHPRTAPLPEAAAQIARWKAPTDVLLQTPGRDLLDRLPVLVSAVPGYPRLEEEKAPGQTPRHSKTSRASEPMKGVQ